MQPKDYSKLKLLTAWDEGDDVKLVCKYQDELGQWKRGVKTITDVQWYFAIRLEDEARARATIDFYHVRNVVTGTTQYKGEWLKVYCKKSPQIYKNGNYANTYSVRNMCAELRKEGIVLYEADLSLWKRFVIDNKIEVAGELDILYFDIETDDTNNGIEIGRDTILSWAAVNNKGEKFYFVNDHSDTGEKAILTEFLNVANKHDLLCGWNSGGFDLPYIQARIAKHNIDDRGMFKKKLHIDMMQRCARVYSYDMFNIGLKGFSLNEVCRVFLNESKVAHAEGIKEMWENNPELLKEYNIQDAELLLRLDKKLLVTDLMIKECVWTGACLDRFYIGELLDSYILRRTRELGFFQHERPDYQTAQLMGDIQIRGGFVMSPLAGLYDNVRVCDFRSLYPSIMVGFNIGRDSLNKALSDEGFVAMDTFLKARKSKIEEVPFEEWKDFLASEKARLDPNNEHIQAANNTFFRRDKLSFVGALVKHLLDLRAQWKAQAKNLPKDSPEALNIQQSQGIVKEMANSMYGITGDKTSRYFDQHVAEAITLTGQYMNRLSTYYAKQRGFTTIYGDTDSIFLPIDSDEDMDNLIKNVNSDLANYLDNEIGSKDNIVLLQYEKKFSRLIMLDKKRYTGKLVVYDGNVVDKIFSRGTENIKKNTIKLARVAIIELINLIVDHKLTNESAKEWVEKLKFKVLHTEIDPGDLTTIIKVSKPTEQYVAKPLHVRLAERLIAEGKLLPIVEGKRSWGTRLDYIVCRMEDGSQEGMLIDEYRGNWDQTYYWDVQIYAPIQRIMAVSFPDVDWSQYEIASAEKKFAEAVKRETKIAKQILAEKEKQEKMDAKTVKKAEKEAILLAKARKKTDDVKASLRKSVVNR